MKGVAVGIFSSACTLIQDAFSEENRQYFEESLAMC